MSSIRYFITPWVFAHPEHLHDYDRLAKEPSIDLNKPIGISNVIPVQYFNSSDQSYTLGARFLWCNSLPCNSLWCDNDRLIFL